MSVDILKIKTQRLSAVLDDYLICESCQIVDNNSKRIRVGYKCPNCHAPSKGGRSYFPMNADILIDLMQEYYHFQSELDIAKGNKHHLAIVIFFCSFGEVLLYHFLDKCMQNQKLSFEIRRRLLQDNLYMKERIERLFPALCKGKWLDALKAISNKNINYVETHKYFKAVVDARNKLIHRGMKWSIPKDMPEKCIYQIQPLLSMFVNLHNRYIVKNPG